MAAAFALRFVAGKYKGGEFPLRQNREIVVGRGSEFDMVLDEDMVSRRHAKIVTMNGQILLQDLKSTNGTFVNGEKISVARLSVGDKVLIGTSIMQLIELAGAAISWPPAEGAAPARESKPTGMGLPAFPTGPASAPASVSAETSAGRPPPEPGPVVLPPTRTHRISEPIAVVPDDSEAVEGMGGHFPDDVELTELIELFNANGRTGVLEVNDPHGQHGQVLFREGRVCFALLEGCEARSPTKMLFRILCWPEGDFLFEARKSIPPREDEIEQDTRNLVLELTRQFDELNKYEGHLPAVDAMLQLKLPLEARLSDLSAETLDTLQAVLNYGVVSKVLDYTLASDLESYQDLLYLLQNGYVDFE